jgi:MFS family permease
MDEPVAWYKTLWRKVASVTSLLGSSSIHRDVILLFLQRIVRMFAFGGSTLVLSIFLSALGVPEKNIGIFMSSTLIGDVIISFATSRYADRMGRRRVLALGSLLMAMSGYIFATSDNFWLLLGASILGVISPR